MSETPVETGVNKGKMETEASMPQQVEWARADGLSVLNVPKSSSIASLKEELEAMANVPGTHIVYMAGRKLTQAEFAILPPGTIAGDGVYDEETGCHDGKANFDHHDGDRLVNPAMCEQTFRAKEDQSFEKEIPIQAGKGRIVVANHFDPDISTAIATVALYDELDPEQRRRLHSYASAVGKVDAYGGCFDLPEVDMMEIKGTTEPITLARRGNWLLTRRSAAEKLEIMMAYLRNLREYVSGRAQSLPLETDYKILYDDDDFPLIEEIGSDARWKLAREGKKRFITDRGSFNGSGKRLYSFVNVEATKEQADRFPIDRMIPILNRMEWLDEYWHSESLEAQLGAALALPNTPTKPWGGSKIGGNFEGGSRYTPTELPHVLRAIKRHLDQEDRQTEIADRIQGAGSRVAALVRA